MQCGFYNYYCANPRNRGPWVDLSLHQILAVYPIPTFVRSRLAYHNIPPTPYFQTFLRSCFSSSLKSGIISRHIETLKFATKIMTNTYMYSHNIEYYTCLKQKANHKTYSHYNHTVTKRS